MGARQSTTRQDKEVPQPPPAPPVRRDGLNAPAAALCAAGASSLLAYRLTAPRAVAGVSSPGAVLAGLKTWHWVQIGIASLILLGWATCCCMSTSADDDGERDALNGDDASPGYGVTGV